MHKKSNLLGLMMPGKEERSNDNAIIGEYGRDTKRTDSSINHAPMIFKGTLHFHFRNFIDSAISLVFMNERTMAKVHYGATYSALTSTTIDYGIWMDLIERELNMCVFTTEQHQIGQLQHVVPHPEN